jgi:hypothetical protein
MERRFWKLATLGVALVGTTALSTGIITAYVMRAPAAADVTPRDAPAPARALAASRVVPSRPLGRVASPVAPPRVTPASTAPADCDTGRERAVRIAKPGVVGALLGAGLGAAGGAIADGGTAAGKGALIGGLAGAALGTGYGAYQTKATCGTIFGERDGAPAAQGLTVHDVR